MEESNEESTTNENILIDVAILESVLGMKAASVERILGLNQRSLSDRDFLILPETQALLRLICHMPWLLEVVEHKFDPEKASLLLQREVINMKLRE